MDMSCIIPISVGKPKIKNAEIKIFTPTDLNLGGSLEMIVLNPRNTIVRTIKATTKSFIMAELILFSPASSKNVRRVNV